MRFVVTLQAQVELRNQDIGGEAGIDRIGVSQRPHEQSGGDEQYQRDSDLRNNERSAKASASRAADLCALPQLADGYYVI